MLERGFHTLIKNILFSSPTDVGSHISIDTITFVYANILAVRFNQYQSTMELFSASFLNNIQRKDTGINKIGIFGTQEHICTKSDPIQVKYVEEN